MNCAIYAKLLPATETFRKNPLKILLLIAALFLILTGFQQVLAQDLIPVSEGKYSYRPVVKNNRVLWFENREGNQTVGRISLYLYENGDNKLITNDASVLFPGWPDLDDDGNIVFMKNMGRSHEVFLYNGITKTETQLTNNSAIKNSTIDMGLGTAKVYTGYARVHGGDVVFKNKLGNIYLYQQKTKAIRVITADLAQIANLGDDDADKGSTGIAVPGSAHVKYFEFDGKHIVWMHEERGSGNNSTVSIYMAEYSSKPELNFKPKLIKSFEAWVPNDKSVLIGKLWNPFFRACNGTIIWQYYLPSKPLPEMPAGVKLPKLLQKDYGADMDDVRVGFYDGSAVTEISNGTTVAFQSVRIVDGRAIWSQMRKEGEGKNIDEFDEIISFNSQGRKVIASYPEKPKHAEIGEKVWDGILDVEIIGNDTFWVMGQSECFEQFKIPITNQLFCMYRATTDVGFFRESSGTFEPFKVINNQTFGGAGEIDRGLYAFFSNKGPSIRDITAMNIYGGEIESAANQLTIIDRKTPDAKKWNSNEKQRKQISDAFSINYDSIAACGETAGSDEVTIESVTLDVKVEKSPAARFEDIQSVSLYNDENGNGIIDPADKRLGNRNSPIAAEVIFVFSGDGIKIRKNIPKYFIVEMEIKDDVCPCGKYTVSISGEKLGFKKQVGSESTATGKSTGSFIMPEAKLKDKRGDEQAGLPNQNLPENLVVVFENFPVRCGKAKFKITTQPFEKGAKISSSFGASIDEVILDLTQIGKDAHAEVGFQLGKTDGLYTVTVSIVMPEGIVCNNEYHIFREHAGKMVVQLIDLNNPDYFSATADNSNPDFDTWKATMSTDVEKLSVGGEGREGALADGTSMLMIRAKLIGFTEPPPGNVDISISGDQNFGHLTKGLGETIPAYNGGSSVSIQWVKTRTGIFGFALYTPPENFGYVSGHKRNVRVEVTYAMPGSSLVNKQDLMLMKPSIAFVHGLWSGPDTWGNPYKLHSSQYEVHFIDYEELSSRSFTDVSTELKFGIADIVRKLRQRKIAATRVNVVGHSMGGLVARQHFADDHGKRFFRKDNFGKGDIYKLVSLGTPHYGSPVAWLAVTMRDQRFNPFLDVANAAGLDLNGGAIDALCPGSQDLQGLGTTHIPSHTVRAWNFDSQTNAFSYEDFIFSMTKSLRKVFSDPKTGVMGAKNFNPMALLTSFVKYSAKGTGKILLADLYNADKTDMLVTVDSQAGGITQGSRKVFAKTIHFDTGEDLSPLLFSETTSEQVAAHIFDVLNHDYNDNMSFSKSLPAPQFHDPTIVCTQRR